MLGLESITKLHSQEGFNEPVPQQRGEGKPPWEENSWETSHVNA